MNEFAFTLHGRSRQIGTGRSGQALKPAPAIVAMQTGCRLGQAPKPA